MLSAYMWLGVGIFCLIIEIFTADFLFATIGIACLIASVPAFMGAGFTVQAVIFAISGTVIFATVRPVVKKLIQGKNHAKERGLNTLVDKKGVVIEDIVNAEDRGQVKIDGDIWRACSETGEIIEKGAHVVVKRSESIILFVERR